VSQENGNKADAAEARTQQTRGFMQKVRAAARRKYTPEEKIRIVLEGFRWEVAINECCQPSRLSRIPDIVEAIFSESVGRFRIADK
jgi:transposase-like protein